MKVNACNNSVVAALAASLLLMTAFAAPMHEGDDEGPDGALGREADGELGAPWDAVDTAALRKLLLQLDADERVSMNRVSRSWPQPEPRGWGVRALDGRVARQWRADKRQVRFRQCYFNPISCFRK